MDLLKNFTLRGLWQSGSKVAIPQGTFRRFTNSFKDRSGKIFPFGRGEATGNNEITAMPGVTTGVTVGATQFKGGLLQVIRNEETTSPTATVGFRYSDEDNDAFDIIQPLRDQFNAALYGIDSTTSRELKDSGEYTFASVFNKTMLCVGANTQKYSTSASPTSFVVPNGNLLAFDGERVREAGLPLPWNPLTNVGAGALGAFYSRSLYVTMGADGEPVFSQYLQIQHNGTAVVARLSGFLGAPSSYTATRLTDPIATTTIPTYRVQGDSLFNDNKYYDRRFIRGFIGGGVPFQGLQLSGGYPTVYWSEISAGLQVGDKVMYRVRYDFVTPAELNLNSDLLKFKVREVGTSGVDPAVFEDEFEIFDYTTFTWITRNFSDYWNSWSAGVRTNWVSDCTAYSAFCFANIFQISAYATTATGSFVVNLIEPYAHVSGLQRTGITLSTSPAVRPTKYFNFMGVVTDFLADWYDVATSKTTFPPMTGVTQYKGLVVGHDDNAIYFSDVSLGGSSEMISGSSNIVPFGAEYGKITAVCGCEDFLLISRERRNFVLRGDIAGAFSLSECDLPVPGAYNSRACTNAWSGQIMFVNRVGIFTVGSTGNITEISAPIRDLFIGTNVDDNLFQKSIFKTPAQLKTTTVVGDVTYPPQDGSFFQFALDAERGFVFLLTGARETTIDNTDPMNPVYGDAFTQTSNILVFDTSDQSWYEWEVSGCTAIEAYLSKLYTFGTDCNIEDGVLRGAEKQIIATQYDTAGAPSLQKQVNQVKLYGKFIPATGGTLGCKVLQQNDWEVLSGSKVTDTTYTADSASQYNHKQRLDSSKPMATSIILESLPEGGIVLDAMEIEGMMLQQGVKQ